MTVPSPLTFSHIDHEALHAALARQRKVLQGEIQPRTSALLHDTEARIAELDAALSAVREALAQAERDMEAMRDVCADMKAFERDAAVELMGHLELQSKLRAAGVVANG